MKIENSFRINLSLVSVAVAALILVFVLFKTRYFVLSALIGITFGVLISPLMNFLSDRFRVPRMVSAIFVILSLLGGMGAISYGLFVLIADQAELLSRRTPEIMASVQRQLNQILADQEWIREQVQKLNIGSTMRNAMGTIFQGLQTSITVIAGTLLAFAIGIYSAVNSEQYRAGFLSVFPSYLRPKAAMVMHETAIILRQWFKGQVIVMTITGTLTTIGLRVLDIDYWLVLGVLTGVLGFIPYIGAFLTGILTVLVTFGSNPDQVWWVLGLYIFIQQFEGNISIPLVMKGSVQLPEVHLIILMVMMGSLFGLIGVFIAPPLLAVLRTVYMLTYVPKMNETIGPGGVKVNPLILQ